MKSIFILLFVVAGTETNLFSQAMKGQARIDSLVAVLKTAGEDTGKANILNAIGFEFKDSDPDTARYFAKRALALSNKLNFNKGRAEAEVGLAVACVNLGQYEEAMTHLDKAITQNDIKSTGRAYHLIGMVYQIRSSYPQALENYFRSLKIKESLNDQKGLADSYNNIGIVYYNLFNDKKALEYYFKAMKIKEAMGDLRGMAYSYNNIGNILKAEKDQTQALEYFLKSLRIKKTLNDPVGIAISMTNIADIFCTIFETDSLKNKTLSIPNTEVKNYPYASLPDSALTLYLKALAINREQDKKYNCIYNLSGIGRVYRLKQKYAMAIRYYNESYQIAEILKSTDRQKDVAEGLVLCYHKLNDFKNAFYWQEKFIMHKDSVFNEEKTQALTRSEMNYEYEKKEALVKAEQEKKDALAKKELQHQKKVRNGFIAGFALMLLFAGIFFMQRNRIRKGKKLSDELLLNILPAEVAEELKAKGSAEAKQFDQVTVLFTDFKDFTQISEKMTARELVEEIHTCFMAFDKIMERHGIEKIKTIGDSYMCASGLPVANKTNALDVVNAGLEIQQFVLNRMSERSASGLVPFQIRIGIHTGPVVAGIVGIKKFAYDIWGDTVNIASRMESSGEAGKVNISETTYQLVKVKFRCTHRGKIQAKNKGEIDMYFVEGSI